MQWKTLCIPVRGWDWQRAYVWALNVIIHNLSVVPGVCKIKAHSCKRMHCYYGSSVYVCNDVGLEIFSCPFQTVFDTKEERFTDQTNFAERPRGKTRLQLPRIFRPRHHQPLHYRPSQSQDRSSRRPGISY